MFIRETKKRHSLSDPHKLDAQQQQAQRLLVYTSTFLTASQAEAQSPQPSTSIQSPTTITTLSKRERDDNMFINHPNMQGLTANMLPLYKSSREVLDDFIKQLPRGSAYAPFATETFAHDNAKWFLCFYSRQTHYRPDSGVIVEGISRVWTLRAPHVFAPAPSSGGLGASWSYSAATTVMMGGGEPPQIIQVFIEVPWSVEPTWDDVVRCLQGANQKDMQSGAKLNQPGTTPPYAQRTVPMQKTNSQMLPYQVTRPTPTKTQRRGYDCVSGTSLTTLPTKNVVLTTVNSSVTRKAPSFGVTRNGSPVLTKALHPSASPDGNYISAARQSTSAAIQSSSSRIRKLVAPRGVPRLTAELTTFRLPAGRPPITRGIQRPSTQEVRAPCSYTVRPPISHSSRVPGTVLPAPCLPPLGSIPGHSPPHSNRKLGSNIEFRKYGTTAGGGIQTLYPNQHTTQQESTATVRSKISTSPQVTEPVHTEDLSRKEVYAIKGTVESLVTCIEGSEQPGIQ